MSKVHRAGLEMTTTLSQESRPSGKFIETSQAVMSVHESGSAGQGWRPVSYHITRAGITGARAYGPELR